MSDSEKPFACTTEGCNMSFVNEDHLTVHKKKHDMMLNLGINNKNNFFIADQTPTPTRFIRNCDEVGLFQDLQNENPFEETFRRAVEAGKSGVLTVPEVDENDDTLHTPNVFPHITEECTSSVNTRNQTEKSDIKPFAALQPVSNKGITIEKDEKPGEVINQISYNVIPKEDIIIHTAPDSSLNNNAVTKTETQLPINGVEMQLLLKTQDGKVLEFITAPVAGVQENFINPKTKEQSIPKIKIAPNNCSKQDLKIMQRQKLSAAKMKLKQALIKNGTVIENKSNQNVGNENKIKGPSKDENRNNIDSSKKRAILERNRASSMRSRAKRKAWIEQLQQSLQIANEANVCLQEEVKNLHVQVAKLKALLLAHKDCPITKAMERGNALVVGSKVVMIKPNEVKQIPVVVGSVKPIKRPSTEKPAATKKKYTTLPTVKNPMILPKSDATANTITLHAADGIKTIPTISIVAPVGTSAGFLHPEPGKVSIIQNAFALDESFDENAASRTTGS